MVKKKAQSLVDEIQEVRVERIEHAIKEFQAASVKIMGVNLENVVTNKFEVRQCKIAVELNAFIEALCRQLISAKKREAKLASLNAELERLKKELGE